MFCQFPYSPHSWYFLLFWCALTPATILGQVDPEVVHLQLPNHNRENQRDSAPEVVHLSLDDVKHSAPDKAVILNNNNISSSGPDTILIKPTISDKVISSTDANTVAIANNGSAVGKPAWDGTSSATVSQQDMDSGALFRLFFVLSGLCVFSIVYVGYRFYRTRKGDSKPLAVRKYGVLTQRTDIEMLPLPLDDEDDDDTVFDVGHHSGGR